MRIRYLRSVIVLLSLILSASAAQAQFLGIGRRAQPGEAPPKAILVELLTRRGQRAYLVEHRPDLLPEFDHDVSEVARRTVLDWTTFFSFCPVYFFRDTMDNQVRDGNWSGVLLDSTMRPVDAPVLAPGDKNFYIAYYGSPIPQPDTARPRNINNLGQNMEHDGDYATALLKECLLVTDAKFILLPGNGPRTNFVRAVRNQSMSARQARAFRRAITYNARRWYIDYQPVAYSYDATLRRYFR